MIVKYDPKTPLQKPPALRQGIPRPDRAPNGQQLPAWFQQLRLLDPIASRQIDREIDGKIPCPPRPGHIK
jgi:hypothetical protein